jgi:hypothetical protein
MPGVHTKEKICPTGNAEFENFVQGVEKYLAKSESHGTENPNASKNSKSPAVA